MTTRATKKKVGNKKSATRIPAKKEAQKKPETAETVETETVETEQDTTGDNDESGKEPDGADAGEQKKDWKKYQDVFKKVTITAEIEGVGKIPVTLIEVAHEGETYRARTRKEAQQWLRDKRKEAQAKMKAEKEALREQKEMERAEKVAGYIDEKIEMLACKIAVLATNKVISDDDRKAIEAAIESIMDVVAKRRREESEEKTDEQ